MQLMECLRQTPTEQLSRIARAAGLEPGTDGQGLASCIADHLKDPAYLQQMLAGLSDEEWAALKVVFFNGGDQGITVELCHQIVNLLSGKRRKSPAPALAQLQNSGLIYPRTQNYRQVFFIPTDLLSALSDLLHRHMIARVCLAPEAPLRPSPLERDLIEDAHRFLAYIYKHDVTLTQQGQILKRHLRALLDLLATDVEEDEGLTGRYPEPLGFLMGYVLDRRLIMRVEGELRPTDELNAWLQQPIGLKQFDLFRYWQDRYFYQDLQTFLSVIRTIGSQWVSLERLANEVEPLINPSHRGSFLLRLKHHLATFLAPLGLFELGQAGSPDQPEMVCLLTPLGELVLQDRPPTENPAPTQPEMVLQATFEAIVPRPAPPEVLWTMELAADLVKRTDRTLTYRLSRQSLFRALKAGLTGERLLAFLHTHSATGVPQNVAFDLITWVKSYGQLYLQQVTLLRCASPLLAEQVKASRRTSRFVLGELTPTDLIVDAKQYKELLEALEADGLMPRPGIEQLS